MVSLSRLQRGNFDPGIFQRITNQLRILRCLRMISVQTESIQPDVSPTKLNSSSSKLHCMDGNFLRSGDDCSCLFTGDQGPVKIVGSVGEAFTSNSKPRFKARFDQL